MADSGITPAAQPDPPARTKSAEVLRESRKFGQWFLNLRPDQLQAFTLTLMTLFLIMLVAWIVYRSDLSREKDKDRETQAREAMTRECNTQGELIRQANAIEQDKNRAATAQLAKDVQANQKEMMSIMLQSHAAEREKDRLHDMERDREHLKIVKEIQNAWAAFAVKFADLERFLRGKPPIEDVLRDILSPWLRPSVP